MRKNVKDSDDKGGADAEALDIEDVSEHDARDETAD